MKYNKYTQYAIHIHTSDNVTDSILNAVWKIKIMLLKSKKGFSSYKVDV